MKYRIVEFDPSIAPEDLLERYFDFENRMFRESEAEDPLPLQERRREAIGDTNPQRKVFRWIVIGDTDGQETVIGESEIAFVTEKSACFLIRRTLHVPEGQRVQAGSLHSFWRNLAILSTSARISLCANTNHLQIAYGSGKTGSPRRSEE